MRVYDNDLHYDWYCNKLFNNDFKMIVRFQVYPGLNLRQKVNVRIFGSHLSLKGVTLLRICDKTLIKNWHHVTNCANKNKFAKLRQYT